ncbi:hypothetical protein TRFO_14792 [Tritrichomonas foetus]|uniref:Protein kinase domain-containing protein n=1 Tax=Tritrichomonas foetus TaxID=1144522 RepID=A0A1J4KZ21_9EUKA|nr:hypothetical protein TRFO_14792 [Tritrichomonas foetus]|eukprot:OHT14837.1 hypothetical protein TRFO_14792 [Tritrichomonas foetus]
MTFSENSLTQNKQTNLKQTNISKSMSQSAVTTAEKSYKFSHRSSLTSIQAGIYIRQFQNTKLHDGVDIPNLEKDFNTTMGIKSPFIVNYQCYKEKPDHVALIRPFVHGYSLLSYIKKHGALKLQLVLNTAAQIAIAVREMHHHDVEAKALLAQNVIVLPDGHIQLVDVGFEAIKNDSIGIIQSPAALLFLGPEGAKGNYNSTKELDIWNFGVLIFLMATGDLPFVDSNLPKMMKNITAGDFSINSDVITDDRLRSIVSKMLVADPSKRPSIDIVKSEIEAARQAFKNSTVKLPSAMMMSHGQLAPMVMQTAAVAKSEKFHTPVVKDDANNKMIIMPKTRKVNSLNGVVFKRAGM